LYIAKIAEICSTFDNEYTVIFFGAEHWLINIITRPRGYAFGDVVEMVVAS
jgi:uncharacterized membrane-anchored protein